MDPAKSVFTLAFGALGFAVTCQSDPIQYPGTGHFYEVVSPGTPITWDQGRDGAAAHTWQGISGHLATIGSIGENQFIYDLGISDNGGAWIGGFQPPDTGEPAGGWEWLTGEPWVFTNWAPGEPNEDTRGAPSEDALQFYGPGSCCPGKWNDVWTGTGVRDYVVEYDVEDTDGDGVFDHLDNCPSVFNPDQDDFDADGIGDPCDEDADGDGVIDAVDECLWTTLGDLVDPATGCSIADLCPCENEWKNHGAYVSCIAHWADMFLGIGLITEEQKDAIVSTAARSDCGKKRK